MRSTAWRAAGMMALVGILGGLSGCDWWPPTLQERIGAQETQLKVIESERAALQTKVAALTKTTEGLKAQAAQMAQSNAQLKAQVDQLTAALEEERAKSKKGKKK